MTRRSWTGRRCADLTCMCPCIMGWVGWGGVVMDWAPRWAALLLGVWSWIIMTAAMPDMKCATSPHPHVRRPTALT